MDPFTLWLTVGGIATACVTSMLYVVAAVFRDEQRVRDLRDSVSHLREDYHRRLKAMEANGGMLVLTTDDVVQQPDTPVAPPQRRAA